MHHRPYFPKARLQSLGILFGVLASFSILVYSKSKNGAPVSAIDSKTYKYEVFSLKASSPTPFDSKAQKLDAAARILLAESTVKSEQAARTFMRKSGISFKATGGGSLDIDMFIQLQPGRSATELAALGVETRTQIGDIVVARAPVATLAALALAPAVSRVELSKTMAALLDASRIDINADDVHQGVGLPQGYRGEGVVVGVIDTGIDFTNSDFSDQNGTRIQHLLEFTQDGGQNEWTKNNIDNNATSVTQIDGDGGGGHGTHVTGTAAGGGQLNSSFTGIAPKADIIFVKGVRDANSDGGFSDVDVLTGCEFIFNKAGAMGKPAVINLSLGGHSGPHDGTSLYEQSLSNLTGPGKIIVAAAGNSGSDFIHAGGTVTPNVLNETILVADSSDQFAVGEMWYEPGTINEVGVFAYDDQFNVLGSIPAINVGQFADFTPIVADSDTLGFVEIDAITTADPNNGDGNVVFVIKNNDSPTIDISDVTWGLASIGQSTGRVDMWVTTGGHFFDDIVGFQGENEMPGNNDHSVTTPSTANKVIAVGAYMTKKIWTSEDGNTYQRLYPDPNDRTQTIVPTVGQIAHFTGRGPTRDGRTSPDITAPGDIIFAPLSSHLTEGVGFRLSRIIQGGGYLGLQGTSMASPHAAGVVALMLQTKPDLTYTEAIQALAAAARSNQFTGSTPNNDVGAGYIDALAAVKKVLDLVSSVENSDDAMPEAFVLKQNYPNPFNPSTTIEYALTTEAQAVLRIYNVAGQQIKTLVNETQKAGSYTIQWDGTNDRGRHVASGIYYAKFKAGQLAQTKKMVLMR